MKNYGKLGKSPKEYFYKNGRSLVTSWMRVEVITGIWVLNIL